MTDYYQILGVPQNAGPDEIKKAYRKLANQHHPDKGGDQAKFKDISVAYDTLSDPNKKAEYDQQRAGGTQFRFNTGGFQDINDMFGGGHPFAGAFGHMFGDGFGRQVRRNRDLNIQCTISLLDSYLGKQLEANYHLPSGKPQTVVINIPPGIAHGETIRYQGLGDDTVPNVQRGNLNVTVVVLPDPNFSRENDDLVTSISITPIEAMVGCKKKVNFITGEEKEIDIRPGVETGIEYASHGFGFPNPHTGRKGRLVIRVNIRGCAITDPELVTRLKIIDAEISTRS
jgi:curved DNA-binding protein